ncbi:MULTISPECIES: CaiB/BaiF CoA-transferase family protein [Marinobacter]|jgi:crotonobetainyl-CoA:carnitine CoA-transferase CaiB-like acyl-CoA transferase|uniref:CaiB/BaiF CoA transferase family protein n=1 Tax=Marinobacter TaxID=2742 RepID=UPI0029427D42|nr:CaiB/BaiF CoA-transferase family protein [Marinobacter salarius]WOI20371.1 CaiB/BaiF CoA-transferase family protein [Marinobacter salarius]
MVGALSHIRVLDLSRVLAGPWASQILGDFGADVIKIERPGKGDDTRSWGPPYLKSEDGETDMSAYYLTANRNKKSLAVDISHPEGQKLVRELAAKCDVVIENFKVEGLKRYGLDYESLAAINPALVYCSVTGFGQTGPYAKRSGYDFLIQAMGGLMSLTGRGDDEPGAGPIKVGVALTDIMTGLYACIGVLSALNHRDRTGEGQHVETALLDVQVASLANQAMNYLTTGKSPERMGNAHPNIVPYQDFPTADGDIVVTVGNDSQFRRMCEVMGRSDWPDDPKFSTNRARVANRKELILLLRQETIKRKTWEWLELLEEVNVPCGPVNSLEEVFADPQVRARQMQITMVHEKMGKVPGVGNPLRLGLTPVSYRDAPPTLGQNTKSVLQSVIGLTSTEIEVLVNKGVIE